MATHYSQGKGSYVHRHVQRAKAELAEQYQKFKASGTKNKGETASGFYVTFQYLVGEYPNNEPVNIRVFVWGNSRINALHLALKQPEVEEFILRAKELGFEPSYFVVPSGKVSAMTREGMISKQGY